MTEIELMNGGMLPGKGKNIALLDHGYIKLIETWGSDERIIEAARMSTDGAFRGWGPTCEYCGSAKLTVPIAHADPTALKCSNCGTVEGKPGDEKLLSYLYKNNHSTPFEMAGAIIEVQAPIFVFREWHRHRTQCLHPDTLVWFERPDNGRPYPMRIEDIWRKWQPTERAERPERQTNALFPRERIEKMRLRCLNEETNEFTTTHIVDVIKGEPKPMVTVTTKRFTLTATLAHRVFTKKGWMTLGEAIEQDLPLAQCGTERNLPEPKMPEQWGDPQWAPVVGWEDYYEVSSLGQVRRIGGPSKKLTRATNGYLVCSLNRPGEQKVALVHRLVAEAHVPNKFQRLTVVRHKDSNPLNNNAQNLEWGSHKENTQDAIQADRFQRLSCKFSAITSVTEAREFETYDLAVAAPWHNFVAEGIVVHNSYNELSARYTPLPDLYYVPTLERCMLNSKTNKQAGRAQGADELTEVRADLFRDALTSEYSVCEAMYQQALRDGVPKELARCIMPVGHYSRMRASANLRNWLGFLTLRQAPNAQWEIRQYAAALNTILVDHFPRTMKLFNE